MPWISNEREKSPQPQNGHDATGQTDSYEVRWGIGFTESTVVCWSICQQNLAVALVNRLRF